MIFCFSGTGNSRYIARRAAEALQEQVTDLNAKIKAGDHSPIQTGRDVIVITPTYAWRIPRIASDWLAQTELTGAERVWFVMNCGSEIGNAAKYNRQLAGQKICAAWERRRSSCRKTISPCSMHRTRRKPGRSCNKQSRILRALLRVWKRDRLSPRPATRSTTAS